MGPKSHGLWVADSSLHLPESQFHASTTVTSYYPSLGNFAYCSLYLASDYKQSPKVFCYLQHFHLKCLNNILSGYTIICPLLATSCWTRGLYRISEQRCSKFEIQRVRKSVLLWSPRSERGEWEEPARIQGPDGSWMLRDLQLARTQHLGPRK